MSRIPALDEIIEQLGPPADLRWVNAPFGVTAAVARFRHRGATLDLSASGVFRLILHLSDSEVETLQDKERPSSWMPQSGSIVTSLTLRREQIHVACAVDTLHLLFSPELVGTIGADRQQRLSRAIEPALRASAVQALVGIARRDEETQLEYAAASVARTLAQTNAFQRSTCGGLSPQARRVVNHLLDTHLHSGISVNELADAAGLSLHHFIKMCRETEGCTPHALLLQRRLERALALLSDGRARVDEVAMDTGFSSPSHFVSTFRRLMGVTPAAFRQAVLA